MLYLLGLQRLLAVQTVFHVLDTLESNSQVFVELSSIWVCWKFVLIARKLYMCHHMINEGHLSRGTCHFFVLFLFFWVGGGPVKLPTSAFI